jgi:hypothetical protein
MNKKEGTNISHPLLILKTPNLKLHTSNPTLQISINPFYNKCAEPSATNMPGLQLKAPPGFFHLTH